MNKPAREQILLTPRLTLAAGQQWWQSASLPAGVTISTNPVYSALGNRRLVGSVFSSVVANTLQVQFSPDGTNFDNTQTLTADPNNANAFPFDFDLQYPYFRFVVTDSGGGSTVQIQASTFEEGSGPTVSGTGPTPPPPPNPNTLAPTYRVAFDGLAAAGTGQFLEIRNPAASGRVLRVTLYLLCKPSATALIKGILQSTLSTGGTATTPTPVRLDQNDGATVGVVKLYTVVPAAGTPVGTNGQVWDVTQGGGDTFADQPGGNTGFVKPFTLRPGQSFAMQSDVAFTAQGVVEFTDAAS